MRQRMTCSLTLKERELPPNTSTIEPFGSRWNASPTNSCSASGGTSSSPANWSHHRSTDASELLDFGSLPGRQIPEVLKSRWAYSWNSVKHRARTASAELTAIANGDPSLKEN